MNKKIKLIYDNKIKIMGMDEVLIFPHYYDVIKIISKN